MLRPQQEIHHHRKQSDRLAVFNLKETYPPPGAETQLVVHGMEFDDLIKGLV